MNYKDYINTHLEEAVQIAKTIDREAIQKTIEILKTIREQGGRVFFLGVGGSAANASHAASDFRMTCNFEAYAPLDNVPQLTALTNDHGWENVFVYWLRNSRLCSKDALFIFSVGGGSEHTSKNLVLAMEYAKEVGARILGIVSRDGGMTRKLGDACILIPVVNEERITPHAEGWQAVLFHLVAHALKEREYRWEGLSKTA
jgi:D-sedoheptulose 7-phosphate isomerase